MRGAHESLEAHEAVKGSSDRAFGMVFAVVFALIAGYQFFTAGRWGGIAAAIAAAFALVAWLRPAVLAPLNRQWMRLGLLLHRVVNPLVMGIMFFGVVLPTGLLMRLFGKDPLRLRREAAAPSYWIERDPAREGHFKDQF